jgi:hypothetical protein
MPARNDSPDWQYSLNAEGPIVVKCAYSLPAGEDYVAKISYVGDRGLIGEVTGDTRALALAAAMELLDDKGLLGMLPVSFVNDLTDYRTV